MLEKAPRIFTLQLAWESHQEGSADIASTLEALASEVRGAALREGARGPQAGGTCCVAWLCYVMCGLGRSLRRLLNQRHRSTRYGP